MEVEKILYIFGSFTRKRQEKRKSLQHSLSAGNSPLHKPSAQPPPLVVPPRVSAYEDKGLRIKAYEVKGLGDWECRICKKVLVEPRLLGCLHSFCTRCLQGLHHEGEVEFWNDGDAGSIQLEPGGSRSGSGAGSAGSGYESELHNSGSEGSWDQEKQHRYGIFTRKISGKSVQLLICPTCGHETTLPLGGMAALPLNYVLLRKIMAAGRDDSDRASVLCDLCTSDNKAERRCSQCLVSVCSSCEEAHGRHQATARHSLHPLDLTPTRFCRRHPDTELSVYCATCQQVVCRDCCVVSHSGHALANAARAAAERARLLRDACERAKYVPEHVELATRQLNSHAMEIDNQAARIEAEVATFAEQYRRAVEAHGRSLCTSATRARARYRQKFAEQTRELETKAVQAGEAVRFAEEILSEANEDEVLSLSGPVLRRLERVTEISGRTSPPRCELRFSASAPANGGLVGRLLTRAPDPEQCVIGTDGLQDLHVDCKHTTTLELRDSSGERIWCGGEQVAGYFRRRDSSATPDFAKVIDKNDGTYSLVICPSNPGAYLFAVTLNNKPIKGSPYPCAVRVTRPHTGQFHCCSFCSSGGKKHATCGCGAAMGGGYKGCGHGHTGHPGSRHWSCCGSTERRGACALPKRPASQTYQFSL